MNAKKILPRSTWLLLCLSFLSLPASAAVDKVAAKLGQIYGSHTATCTATAVTTTGANRSGPFTAGRLVQVYGYSGTSATDMVPVSIKCVQGGSTIDVTAVTQGTIIFGGTKEYWTIDPGNLYISCISAVATQKYDVCYQD